MTYIVVGAVVVLIHSLNLNGESGQEGALKTKAKTEILKQPSVKRVEVNFLLLVHHSIRITGTYVFVLHPIAQYLIKASAYHNDSCKKGLSESLFVQHQSLSFNKQRGNSYKLQKKFFNCEILNFQFSMAMHQARRL